MAESPEALLSELPRVLSRPPWISGRPSRELVVVSVAPKKASSEALALFEATSVFGGWRSDKDGAAWQYFEANVDATLVSILPIAVGEKGPRRKVAERLVRDLALKNGDTVRAVAAR